MESPDESGKAALKHNPSSIGANRSSDEEEGSLSPSRKQQKTDDGDAFREAASEKPAAVPSGPRQQPPNDDDRLGTYLTDDDFAANTAKFQKRCVAKMEIFELRTDEEIREGCQEWLTFNLDRFLKDGTKVPMEQFVEDARMAPQDFGFDESMLHTLDVTELGERLSDVEQWHSDESVRNQFLAPLLPIIQSSGTGKSRVMHFLSHHGDRKETSLSILLSTKPKGQLSVQAESYDYIYQVGQVTTPDNEETERRKLYKFVKEICAKSMKDSGQHKVTLFFDEAQHLAPNKGYLLRVLRWLIREKKFTDDVPTCAITAVLAGTNSSLANFFPETNPQSTSSRHLATDHYYAKGTIPFLPFVTLRTQGGFSRQQLGSSDGGTEYDEMIPYSRPLFAVMHKKGKLDGNKEYEIALKIVLGCVDWHRNETSWLSVLGTRVQMGATSTAVVSDLVAKGYAHLTYYQASKEGGTANRASFAFLPDPVCARLAMCLMDDSFTFTRAGKTSAGTDGAPFRTIHGISKREIADKMGRLFSDGVCLPARGDFGEVAVALYLLLCGDVLRKQLDKTFCRFSIDFGDWMNVLRQGGRGLPGKASENSNLTVNCIQFFRYSYRIPLERLAESPFLEELYKKGCAIYCASGTEAIDLVVPCLDKGKSQYIPIFISVKNCLYMSPKDASEFLHASWEALKVKVGCGLCLFAITGQDWPISNVDRTEYLKRIEADYRHEGLTIVGDALNEVRDELLVDVLCIHEDTFGIHNALQSGSRIKDQQTAEVYGMHSEFIHESETQLPTEIKSCVNAYRKAAKEFFDDTLDCVGMEKVADDARRAKTDSL